MVSVPLIPHPETASASVTDIVVDVARTAVGTAVLHYRASGDISGLIVPPSVAGAGRKDDLWQTTCFEAFVRHGTGPGYAEFNFAPSTAWAAYGFTSCRSGMRRIDLPPPRCDVVVRDDRLEMIVTLDVTASPDVPPGLDWRVNLTAVIQEKGGRKSYWALAHPAGAPDFHDPDCFVLQLPAAG